MRRNKIYVVGRSGRTDRPSVMHQLSDYQATITDCGTDISDLSRSFQSTRIDAIMCKKAGCRA